MLQTPIESPRPISTSQSMVEISGAQIQYQQLTCLCYLQNSLARAVVKAPKSTHITPSLKSLHWLEVNERIEYKLLSLTYKKFLQLLNLAIFTTLSLFNLFAVPALHLLSLFLARQPSPP